MNNKKYKILVLCVALALNTACCVVSATFGEINIFRIVGSYVAFAAVGLLLWKFPMSVQILFLGFTLLASPLGSVLGLYASVPFYDKFVHYLSGIVLGLAGFYIAKKMLHKKQITDNDDFVKLTVAFLFSCSCAAFWEIYEFTVDNVLGMESQGNNANTMGDIVAGILGAVTFTVCKLITLKIKKK